ncbi:MAG: acyl-CoA/acyl-ACP dehydrogenase [Rhodobiaceae bacterium]|nr:acyl-CoA/acyl-ACP dehydrogenase [Rhodobiaceae bacterium]MCC0057328.1 acyl-CoA/acyl-ACP dehydrogenase [Rhodobiaceae bacterium]
MEFSLTDEQRQFQEEVDKALGRISPLERVRKAAASPHEFAQDVWSGLADLGIPAMLVPEAYGGLGLGLLDAVLVAELLGKHVVPAPFLGAAVIAPLALVGFGTDELKSDLLPRIAAGEMRLGAAIAQPVSGNHEKTGLHARSGKLSGKSTFVVDHIGAHGFVVADDDGRLFYVEADAEGLDILTIDTVDRTRGTAQLAFSDVAARPLDGGNEGLGRLADATRLVLAADLLGAGWKMINDAVEYAKIRNQFGRPIGSFQAVKHMCSEMAAGLEPGRALLWYAGYAFDNDLEDASLCCMHAKAYMAEAARFAARTATEVHGGMGITDQLGLQYWFKRVGWSYQAYGSPERLREEAALKQGLIARERFAVGAAP